MPAWRYYTAADLLEMPEDGNKYEVVHGELLVSPSPRLLHQRIVGRLLRLLAEYLDGQPVGEAFPGGDVAFGRDSLVIPDLLVLDRNSARADSWADAAPPILAVEVLSPASARADRFTKRRLYQEIGVPAYWLMDADARVAEVWTPTTEFPVVEQTELRWHPDGATAPLRISLAELFREP